MEASDCSLLLLQRTRRNLLPWPMDAKDDGTDMELLHHDMALQEWQTSWQQFWRVPAEGTGNDTAGCVSNFHEHGRQCHWQGSMPPPPWPCWKHPELDQSPPRCIPCNGRSHLGTEHRPRVATACPECYYLRGIGAWRCTVCSSNKTHSLVWTTMPVWYFVQQARNSHTVHWPPHGADPPEYLRWYPIVLFGLHCSSTNRAYSHEQESILLWGIQGPSDHCSWILQCGMDC